jgi:hypothetical protein
MRKFLLLFLFLIMFSCEEPADKQCDFMQGQQLYEDSKGRCYYINSNGDKNYVNANYCFCH